MSGYAPNPDSSKPAAASLTSSLLARKGQAMPAVDAVAHEGVDIDMHPEGRPKGVRRPVDHDQAMRLANSPPPPAAGARTKARREGVRREVRSPITIDHPPQNWTLADQAQSESPETPNPVSSRYLHGPREKARNAAPRSGGLRATVTFRMPATDFVRLRFASREMKESCQSIIVDAISAYLDANEVEMVDEETALEEAARLSQQGRRRA